MKMPDLDIRTPTDPEDNETGRARMSLPPREFSVVKGATFNTFTILDRQVTQADRSATDSYRIYFLPAAFSPTPTGGSVTVAMPRIFDPAVRRAAQRVASLVTSVQALGFGTALTMQDTQFFGQAGWYYCVAVNKLKIESAPEQILAAP